MDHRLERNSWQELEARLGNCDVAIIPVGGVEQFVAVSLTGSPLKRTADIVSSIEEFFGQEEFFGYGQAER